MVKTFIKEMTGDGRDVIVIKGKKELLNISQFMEKLIVR